MGRGPRAVAVQSTQHHRAGDVADVPLPRAAVSDAARAGLGRPGLQGDADRLPHPDRAFEILGGGSAIDSLNLAALRDLRNPPGERQGIAERVQLRELLRRVVVKVMQENKLDLMINVHSSLPPGRIGLAPEPIVDDHGASFAFGPNAGITEVLIPAGYVRTAYDATFELATDAERSQVLSRVVPARSRRQSPAPGLPFSISFWSEPGMEHLTLKAASAYQAISKRRVPPPAFGPLPRGSSSREKPR